MEKEALLSKISEGLGSTQLSETTINAFVDDVYEDVKDSESVSDEFIARKVNYLKAVNGQLHADVATQVNDYKKKNPYRKPKEVPSVDEDEPAWFKTYREKQEERMKAIEDSAKAELEATNRKRVVDSVKDSLKSKFSAEGIDMNNYFLSQAVNDVDFTPAKDENGNDVAADIEKLAKDVEKAYFKHLKEAGIGKPAPKFGNGGGGGEQTDWIKKKFAEKGKREGWKK